MSRPPTLNSLKTVGRATPRIDAVERSTGKATYTGDVHLPGMLYARVLRSTQAHAQIRKIDVSKAQALPGVKFILTHENCSTVWGSGSISGGRQYVDEVKKITKQKRYVFNNPVRFYGEPVAAVVATNRHLAEEAMRLITVEYDPLPFVLDQEEALKPDAVKIWPDGNISLTAKNEAKPEVYSRGNVEEGFRTSDHVFEDRYTTTYVHNAQMEPRVSVASWDGDKLTIYTPTQGISNCRHDMARDLGLPDEKVRVICKYMGGGFGNKNQN
jgi:xanthine dehydrogenase molybdenum-binding subunit